MSDKLALLYLLCELIENVSGVFFFLHYSLKGFPRQCVGLNMCKFFQIGSSCSGCSLWTLVTIRRPTLPGA